MASVLYAKNCAKFHQNRTVVASATVLTNRRADRQTLVIFVVCPMLCYSDGTDKNLLGLSNRIQ